MYLHKIEESLPPIDKDAPTRSKKVLILTKNGSFHLGAYIYDNLAWINNEGNYGLMITHWGILPDLPFTHPANTEK